MWFPNNSAVYSSTLPLVLLLTLLVLLPSSFTSHAWRATSCEIWLGMNACMRSDPRPPTRRQIKARILNDAYYRPILSIGYGAASLYITYTTEWLVHHDGRPTKLKLIYFVSAYYPVLSINRVTYQRRDTMVIKLTSSPLTCC